eukprot:7690176-Alexandrium_andersonii.AAC.1
MQLVGSRVEFWLACAVRAGAYSDVVEFRLALSWTSLDFGELRLRPRAKPANAAGVHQHATNSHEMPTEG